MKALSLEQLEILAFVASTPDATAADYCRARGVELLSQEGARVLSQVRSLVGAGYLDRDVDGRRRPLELAPAAREELAAWLEVLRRLEGAGALEPTRLASGR